ncbi:glycosyltransferase family 39 protein [Candidatus Saccharibacteria bacterium]|nr:glycosyltransferase family 39 protein [Candidatus Saccharibacteria bacterium]
MAIKLTAPRLMRRWPTTVGLIGVAVVAAFFRLWHLDTLPPGLSGGEAAIGLSALALVHHGTWPMLTASDGYAPLWTLLQATAVAIFGHTALALRIWPAIVGFAAVGAVWLLAKDWFGTRVAWVSAVIMAVNPWAVTLSRSAGPAVLATFLVPITLWVSARAATRNQPTWWLLSAALLVINLFAGPLGWVTALAVGVLAVVTLITRQPTFGSPVSWIALAVAGIASLATLGTLIFEHRQVSDLITAAQASSKLATLVTTFGKVAGMFNLHGDDNFLHNFNGEPMFNAFVGLMFVAGLLVALTKLPKRRYLATLVAFVILMLPALASPLGSPNAAHAAAALPIAVILAGVGVGYMLELWHATFPINSAARSTGLAAILLLLALTVFQGYIQIFRAWSGSAQTYTAFNEAAVAASKYLASSHGANKILVASTDEQTVVAYLSYGQTYQAMNAAGVIALPVSTAGHQFIITATVRDETARNLAAKFAGGKLAPHYSSFSQNELYYDYETTQ